MWLVYENKQSYKQYEVHGKKLKPQLNKMKGGKAEPCMKIKI